MTKIFFDSPFNYVKFEVTTLDSHFIFLSSVVLFINIFNFRCILVFDVFAVTPISPLILS